MSKAFVPRKTFEKHWHQVMGGDLKKNPKLLHPGIFIRGATKPAINDAIKNTSAMDFRKFGSLNLIVVRFRGYLLPYDLLTEIKETFCGQLIRPNAFILLKKRQGRQCVGHGGERSAHEREAVAMNMLIAAIAERSLDGPVTSKVEDAIEAAAAGDFGLSAGERHSP